MYVRERAVFLNIATGTHTHPHTIQAHAHQRIHHTDTRTSTEGTTWVSGQISSTHPCVPNRRARSSTRECFGQPNADNTLLRVSATVYHRVWVAGALPRFGYYRAAQSHKRRTILRSRRRCQFCEHQAFHPKDRQAAFLSAMALVLSAASPAPQKGTRILSASCLQRWHLHHILCVVLADGRDRLRCALWVGLPSDILRRWCCAFLTHYL